MMKTRLTLLMTLCCVALSAAGQQADTIYFNGSIYTVNDDRPTAEAVAIRDGKILAVGGKDAVFETKADRTKLVDLGGKTMLPGFVDSHGHTFMIGLQASTANLLPPPDGRGVDIGSIANAAC